MSWRPTKYEDFERIALPNDPSGADVRNLLTDTDECRRTMEENGRTWEVDGQVIAIVGVTPLWKGVGAVWTFLSEESLSRGAMLTLRVLRFIEMLHRERGYWRLQATVERGHEPARLWIVRLGFTYEGTMVAYDMDGKTHDMYGRVRV